MATTTNERVTQLVEITSNEISPEDLLFLSDVSAKESKKLQANSLLTYIHASASINTAHADTADTASYIDANGVVGIVSSASFSTTAVSASHALLSDTSVTASFALLTATVTSVDTASYLQYQGFPNGTASYALTSSFVDNASTASFLQYNSTFNGSASFALSTDSSSFATVAATVLENNITASNAVSASYSDTSSFSTYAANGIISYTNVLGTTQQVGTGGTPAAPFPITGLSTEIAAKYLTSSFLIMLSAVVANGDAVGATSVALWKSSSLFQGPLIQTVANVDLGNSDTVTISATYIDTPFDDPGSPVTYSAQVYNDGGGAWYVNRDKNGTRGGTSSLSVIEFALIQ